LKTAVLNGDKALGQGHELTVQVQQLAHLLSLS
jgi:hypothetical protein